MSFAALALRARAANDTTRAQINNIPSKSHFIVLLKNGVPLVGMAKSCWKNILFLTSVDCGIESSGIS